MGLRAKFNLVILAAFAVGFLIAAVVLNRVFVNGARDQVLQNARIMMSAANAIRHYTAQELFPLLPMEHDGKFVAETIPAYAAQKNFSAVQAAFPGYSYREPALNPTNLANRAQDWEADIVSLFRNEPNRQELVVERDTPFGPTPVFCCSRACAIHAGARAMANTGVRASRGKPIASSRRAASISMLASSRRPGLWRASAATTLRSTSSAKESRADCGSSCCKAARKMSARGSRIRNTRCPKPMSRPPLVKVRSSQARCRRLAKSRRACRARAQAPRRAGFR